MIYFFGFSLSLSLSLLFTPLIRRLALWLRIIDLPNDPRKIHQQPMPLLGGLASFVSFFMVIFILIKLQPDLLKLAAEQINGPIILKNLIGLLIGSALLMIGGFLDDRFNLKPRTQLVWPILAVLAVISSGIGIKFITNPLGGLWRLDAWNSLVFIWQGTPHRIFWLADFFTLGWLMATMYTTKVLDGLDGLVSGIGAIGAMFIFFLSLKIDQPFTALLALIFFGAMVGFWFYNFNPARIFLGEGGSLWVGFMIGTLAIISGGKVASAALLLGIPFLDLVWVSVRRLGFERHTLAQADRKHLHHRLLDLGLTQKQAVLSLYAITMVFGLAAISLQSFGKLLALIILFFIMVLLGSLLVWLSRRQSA